MWSVYASAKVGVCGGGGGGWGGGGGAEEKKREKVNVSSCETAFLCCVDWSALYLCPEQEATDQGSTPEGTFGDE